MHICRQIRIDQAFGLGSSKRSLLIVCVGFWMASVAPAQAPRDQLPAGALVRIHAARPGHEAAVTSVSLAPDGARLASTSFDEALSVWDVATGKELQHITGHPKL